MLIFLLLAPIVTTLILCRINTKIKQIYRYLKLIIILLTSLSSLYFIVFALFPSADISLNFIEDSKFLTLNFGLSIFSSLIMMFFYIISFNVLSFSEKYLDGESTQKKFLIYFSTSLTLVSLFVTSNNLIQVFFIWFLLERASNKLLLLYPESLYAKDCVKTKAFFSYLADIFLIICIVLTLKTFGTTDYEAIKQIIANQVLIFDESNINYIAVFLSLAAIIRSAAFPFHTWLPISLGTATPVSAFMHAGIINAGGIFLIKLSFLLQFSIIAGVFLAVFGTITAIFAMSVMITQCSIKKRLAYSTIGQMGFMIMQCGLGLYSLAILHIIAHASYKAYAFLNSSDSVNQARDQYFDQIESNTPSILYYLAIGSALVVIILLAINNPIINLSYIPVYYIWILFLIHLFILSISQKKRQYSNHIFLAAIIFSLSAFIYILLSNELSKILKSEIGYSWISAENWGMSIATILFVLISFFLAFILQLSVEKLKNNPNWNSTWIHLNQGFYIDLFIIKIVSIFQRKSHPQKINPALIQKNLS